MYPTSTVARFTKISGKYNVTWKAQRALIRVCNSHTKRSRSRSTGSRNARPLRECQKEKGSDIDASPLSAGVQSLDRSRLPWSVPLDRSRSPRSAIKSGVLMHAYATRGLGFLVRCATISRQLHVGLRSGGSPLFMINHRSSLWIHTVAWPPSASQLYEL